MSVKDRRIVKRNFDFVVEYGDNQSSNKATQNGRERVWV